MINVVAGFGALDDIATATLVFNRMCGTGSCEEFIVSSTVSDQILLLEPKNSQSNNNLSIE